MASLASVDGLILPAAEAAIPAADDGLLRGDGAFEVMALYGGRVFALDDHLARLERSAAVLRLEVDVAAVRAEVVALAAAAGAADGALRVVCTRGGRRVLLIEPPKEHAPTMRLTALEFEAGSMLVGVKSLSYAANMLARRIAVERGFDDALLISPQGEVLELPTASVFWVSGSRIATPPLAAGILASITRARLMALTDSEERSCRLAEISAADEVFMVSTTREVVGVAAIDDAELVAPGPVTQRSAELLRARIEAELGAPA